jgi:hypothetical protein
VAKPEHPPHAAQDAGDGSPAKLPLLVIAIAVVSALFVAVAVGARLLLHR